MTSSFRHLYVSCGLLTLLTIACPCKVNSQGLIQTMAEQLAKFEITLQELKQGYNIVQKGLSTISNIKKGDFDLHSLFFSSLSDVNPAIKNYGKVADILSMQVKIFSTSKSSLSSFVSSGQFKPPDISYLTGVFTNLTDLTVKDIDELTGIVTDGNWQMTDDERMARIDALYKIVADKYAFITSFSNKVSLLAQQKKQEKAAIQNLLNMVSP